MAGGAQASSVCCRPPLFNTLAPLRVDDLLPLSSHSNSPSSASRPDSPTHVPQAAAAARIAGKNGIFAAAHTGDIELVLDYLTAIPATVNEKTAKYIPPCTCFQIFSKYVSSSFQLTDSAPFCC
jgi:hypothetical protein